MAETDDLDRFLASHELAKRTMQMLGVTEQEYLCSQGQGKRAIAARQRELLAKEALDAPNPDPDGSSRP